MALVDREHNASQAHQVWAEDLSADSWCHLLCLGTPEGLIYGHVCEDYRHLGSYVAMATTVLVLMGLFIHLFLVGENTLEADVNFRLLDCLVLYAYSCCCHFPLTAETVRRAKKS